MSGSIGQTLIPEMLCCRQTTPARCQDVYYSKKTHQTIEHRPCYVVERSDVMNELIVATAARADGLSHKLDQNTLSMKLELEEVVQAEDPMPLEPKHDASNLVPVLSFQHSIPFSAVTVLI
eukprot:5637281-Amphidinium_carterae.1